jgi:hypothetical protein
MHSCRISHLYFGIRAGVSELPITARLLRDPAMLFNKKRSANLKEKRIVVYRKHSAPGVIQVEVTRSCV